MKCPDCRSAIDIEATSCICGWRAAAAAKPFAVAGQPRPICRAVGCHQPAMNGFAHCLPCDQRIRNEEAEAKCRARGLTTLDEKKEFCRRLAKRMWQRPSFDRWCTTITQAGIDTIVRMNGRDDQHLLERFRDAGVIDGRNQLIPLEGRAIAADARRQEHARRIAETQRELEARGLITADTPPSDVHSS